MNASGCNLASLFNISLMLQRDVFSNSNVSQSLEINQPSLFMLKEWIIHPSYAEMHMFLIPTTFCCITALFFTPFILFAIYSNLSMRHETRFLLLGNTIIYDLIYLVFYTITTICNVMYVKIPEVLCILLLFVLAVAYCGGVLTTASMVADTYLAVLWPLHYISLLSARRTRKLIMLLWFSSLFFPAVALFPLYLTQKPLPCPLEFCSLPVILLIALHGDDTLKFFYILFVTVFLICFSLIICFYLVLYHKTRETGIWKSVFSRARVTFLMHHTILFFYLSPLLLLLLESLLYMSKVIGLRTGLWVTLTICNVLLVFPKAAFPCLYGLRYREIYKSIRLFFSFSKHRMVAPVISNI